MQTFVTHEQMEHLFQMPVENISLYQNAFIHKSASKDLQIESNERLEFVGDAVLSLIVARYLYLQYPDDNEGVLTRLRTKLVNGTNLSYLATKLELDQFILMNEKGMKNEWNTNPRILEDAFEALMGALYLDKGFEVVKDFFLNLVQKHVDFEEIEKDTNYKDILMKWAQNNGLGHPEYILGKESGKEHNKYFVVNVRVQNKVLSEGQGKTKKIAEQNAAFNTLSCLRQI